MKDLLLKWREDSTRVPQLVRLIYNQYKLAKLTSDDKWPIIEQVLMAAIDLRDEKLIKESLLMLEAQFPGSSRVRRLKYMAKLEMRERYEDAITAYDEMIRSDDSNPFPYKRRIAVLIAQKRIPEAIESFTHFLSRFMNDQEAWLELCDLYIREQEYSKAAFCMEELILINPHNYLYHTKLAEIYYTSGLIEMARSYFAQALKLSPNSPRALYGLYMAATNLATTSKSNTAKRKENAKIARWALENVSKLYRDSNVEKSPKIEAERSRAISEPAINSLESLLVGLEIN